MWQRTRAATREAYRITGAFPLTERFGLVTQIRRAAISVSANIVEGSKRVSCREFAHFLNIAEGSAAEARHLLETSAELGYAQPSQSERLAAEYAEIGLMLAALRQRVCKR